ncbi:MAG: hypothetical protein WDO73_31230 [Ignavibacteriota bacterium]
MSDWKRAKSQRTAARHRYRREDVEDSTNSRYYGAAFWHGTSSVNGVTKSGTNRLHGDLFEFLRNTDFDFRQFFEAQRSIFRRSQYSSVLGGPSAPAAESGWCDTRRAPYRRRTDCPGRHVDDVGVVE